MRNWLLFQTTFIGTPAGLLLSAARRGKTHLLPFWVFTPWSSVAETFLVEEEETSVL